MHNVTLCAGTVITLRVCCSLKMNFGSKQFHISCIDLYFPFHLYIHTCSDNKIVFDLRSFGKNDAVANRNAQKKKECLSLNGIWILALWKILVEMLHQRAMKSLTHTYTAPVVEAVLLALSHILPELHDPVLSVSHSQCTLKCALLCMNFLLSSIITLVFKFSPLSSNFASSPKHWSPFFSFPEHYWLTGEADF